MIFGGAPFGGAPFGGPPLVSTAVPAPFTLHIAKSPDRREDIHLLVANPRLKSSGFPGVIFFTDREWVGKPMISPRLARALEFQGSISSGFAGLGGGVPTFGSIRILGDTRYASEALDIDDLWNLYDWHDAAIEIRMGAADFDLNEFGTIFVGRVIDLIRDRTGVEIVIADPSLRLDVPIQTNLYDGTGGTNGDARLASIGKPIAAGINRRIEPVLIDRVKRIYQWNDGATLSTGIIAAIGAMAGVYERGHAGFLRDADTADIHAGDFTTEGSYRCSPTEGKFQLGAPAEGTISIDAYGDVRYGLTAADIVNGLCRARAGYADADFDLPSFADMNADMPAPIGIYLSGGQSPSVLSVVDQILGQGSVVGVPLGWKTFTRLGQLRVGIHKFRTPSRTIRGRQIADTRRERTQPKFEQWKLGYQHCWTPLSDDVLADVVDLTDAERDFVSQDFRSVTWSAPASVQNRSEINTLMDVAADAQAEADRAGALTGTARDFHSTEIYEHQWHIREGDTVTVYGSAEYGWDLPDRDYLVLGLGESTTTGRTALQLWG